MKKVITILMVMVVVTMAIFGYVEADDVDNSAFEFVVYGGNPSEVYGWLGEWIDSCGDLHAKEITKVNDDGVYMSYGILVANEFEEDYGIPCTQNNVVKVMKEQVDLDDFWIVTAGFYDDYAVYKMTAKSTREPIGSCYDYEKKEFVDYYEGSVYFMVVYEE